MPPRKETTLGEVKESAQTQQAPLTIRELATEYKKSTWFTSLAPETKIGYEAQLLKLVDSPHGKRPPDYIGPRLAGAMYQHITTAHGLRTANTFAMVWGRVYRFGIVNEWLTQNPWTYVQKSRALPRDVIWSAEEFVKLVDYIKNLNPVPYPIIRGLWLMYDTAQRPTDVLNMKTELVRQDDMGYYVELRQSKTKKKVNVPLSEEAVGWLDIPNYSHGSEFLIGSKMELGDFRYLFNVYKEGAGLPAKLQLRDLRRTALTEAGLGGATDDQMKALSGHSARGMLDIYSLSTRIKALDAFKARHEARKGVS